MGKIRTLTICFCLILPLTGCWSVHEINKIAIANVIGVDQNKAGEVEVTAVIVKPHAVFPDANRGAGRDQERFIIEKAAGKSIYQAIGTLSNSIPESLYFGHVETVVLGEDAARDRMESIMDFFKREEHFRPNIRILVAKGTAADILNAKPQLSTALGMELIEMAKSDPYASTGMVKDLSKITEEFSSNQIDPVTGVVQYAAKQGITANIPDMLTMQETAVFKAERLIGFLDNRETRGLLWIQGMLRNKVVVVNCGENNKGTVTLAINGANSNMSPRMDKGTPSMDVRIHVKADIGEVDCQGLRLETVQIGQLNTQLENLIREEATTVLQKAKDDWQTDIFGFGRAVYRKYPREWHRLAPKWREGALKNMKVNIQVSANINRYGLHKNPVKANESR